MTTEVFSAFWKLGDYVGIIMENLNILYPGVILEF